MPLHDDICASHRGHTCDCPSAAFSESRDASCSANTDRELWRAVPEDYYAPSVFVTRDGGIGMNHGGTVFVMTVEEWIKRAQAFISQNTEVSSER